MGKAERVKRKKYPIVVGGTKTDDNKIICNGCKKVLQGYMTMHWDGAKEYGYNYKCANCGNVVGLTFRRSKEQRRYWE